MLKDPGDFLVGPGVYYVDGIRAANEDLFAIVIRATFNGPGR